jgi:acyl-[acyl-carrier-protein]-phospholipid O-acyltransferase/long-chain-fatty-acid--[acyl-carrier-protein] ligase
VSSSEGDGWYDTGDVAEVDADGFVYLVGRVKRFAKVAGEMVSLELVELLAQASSPAASHAASTQPDALRGEAVVLFTTDASLSRESLQRKARELGYAELVVPRKLVMLESLPLLGSGKLDYVTLRGMAEEV